MELNLEDVICAICRNILIEPVTLPCEHRFCKICFAKSLHETSYCCALCKKRLSNFLRKQKNVDLVDKPLWQQIQSQFSSQIMNTEIDLGTELRTSHVPHVICPEGEFGKDFNKMYKDMYNQYISEITQPDSATVNVIKELQNQEEEESNRSELQLKADEEFARKLQKQYEREVNYDGPYSSTRRRSSLQNLNQTNRNQLLMDSFVVLNRDHGKKLNEAKHTMTLKDLGTHSAVSRPGTTHTVTSENVSTKSSGDSSVATHTTLENTVLKSAANSPVAEHTVTLENVGTKSSGDSSVATHTTLENTVLKSAANSPVAEHTVTLENVGTKSSGESSLATHTTTLEKIFLKSVGNSHVAKHTATSGNVGTKSSGDSSVATHTTTLEKIFLKSVSHVAKHTATSGNVGTKSSGDSSVATYTTTLKNIVLKSVGNSPVAKHTATSANVVSQSFGDSPLGKPMMILDADMSSEKVIASDYNVGEESGHVLGESTFSNGNLLKIVAKKSQDKGQEYGVWMREKLENLGEHIQCDLPNNNAKKSNFKRQPKMKTPVKNATATQTLSSINSPNEGQPSKAPTPRKCLLNSSDLHHEVEPLALSNFSASKRSRFSAFSSTKDNNQTEDSGNAAKRSKEEEDSTATEINLENIDFQQQKEIAERIEQEKKDRALAEKLQCDWEAVRLRSRRMDKYKQLTLDFHK